MKSFAQSSSWVLMPLLMPIYALVFVLFVPSEPESIGIGSSMYLFPAQNKWLILLYYVFFIVLVPGIFFMLLKRLKVVQSIEMDERKERSIPSIIMASFCLILFFKFTSIPFEFPKYVYTLCLTGALVIVIFTLINIVLKISLHAAGAGILTAYVFSYAMEQLYFPIWILVLVVLMSGWVLSARLYLEKHQPIEIFLGYILSLFITFAINYYYPNTVY